MGTGVSVGFYGKLPCRGDFLQRRVAQEFVDVWDGWLQEGLQASRRSLGEGWLDAWLTAPVWRFALAPGVCGGSAYAGVMLPSVDSVGRYFPLTVVADLGAESCVLDVAAHSGRQWIEEAETLALDALQAADLDLEAFDDRVAALAGLQDARHAAEADDLRRILQDMRSGRQPPQWRIPLASVHSLQRAVNVLAAGELERTLRPLALWWTEGSDAIAPVWWCSRGLPAPQGYAAMIAGERQGADQAGAESGGAESGPAQPGRALESAAAGGVLGELGVRDATAAGGDARGMEAAVSGVAAGVGADRAAGAGRKAAGAAAAPSGNDVEAAAVPVGITVVHEPLTRHWDAPAVHFVERPDLGLWCVTGPAQGAGAATAQAVADVLQDVAQAGMLTALVEEVRRALERVWRHLGEGAAADALVFLARRSECALVCVGGAQAVRCRAGQATPMLGLAGCAEPAAEYRIAPSADRSASLMDLVAAPAQPALAVRIRYEPLRSGDVWVLAGSALLDERSLPGMAAQVGGVAAPLSALAAVRGACHAQAAHSCGATLPVLVATAAALS